MSVCVYEKERDKEIVAWSPPPPLSFVTSSFSFQARVAHTERLFCLVVSLKRMRDRVNRAISYHTTLSPDDDDNNDGGFK